MIPVFIKSQNSKPMKQIRKQIMLYARVILILILIMPLLSAGLSNNSENTEEWNKLSAEDQEFLDKVQLKAYDYF